MINRIKHIIGHYGLTSTQFADNIGVQRSAVSHVMSERNKPSLDFVLKIKKAYPKINLDWLILGVGTMLKNENESDVMTNDIDKNIQTELSFNKKTDTNRNSESFMNDKQTLFTNKEKGKDEDFKQENRDIHKESASNIVTPEVIIFYYADRTFKTYRPK